jgi:hypothetical protein
MYSYMLFGQEMSSYGRQVTCQVSSDALGTLNVVQFVALEREELQRWRVEDMWGGVCHSASDILYVFAACSP